VRLKRILSFLHLWCGLLLFVPLVALGLSGSVLVFHDEIDRWSGTAPPAASGAGPARSVAEIIEAARAAVPVGATATAVRIPEVPGEPATVRFANRRDPDAPPVQGPPGIAGTAPVYVDAATLELLGTGQVLAPGGSRSFTRLMHDLHGNLLIGGRTGREVVGWFGVVMLFLGVSGIVMWWPRRGQWKRGFTVRWRASAQTLNRDLHGAVGIWLWLVFIIISFSGTYIVFPQTFNAPLLALFDGKTAPAPNAVQIAAPARGAERMAPDAVVALAREAAGGNVELRSLFFPARPNQPFRVGLAAPGTPHGAPAITAFVDPYAGTVIELRDPRRYTFAETLMAWQRPVHYGEGLGWVWKILTFISGLLPLLFVITGFVLWWSKRRNRRLMVSRAVAATRASASPAE
jgi:uncharacterized iron-regulated membrane protein